MAGEARPTNETTNYFAVGKQSAKDTEATTFYFLKHLDGTGFEPDTDYQSEHEGGDGQEIGLRYKSMIKGDGAMVVNARNQVAARLLAYALGADSWASAVAGATLADHTISPSGTMPYLTMEQRWVDQIERMTNGNLTGLTIEGEAGRPFKFTANFIAGGTVYQRDISSTLTATRESGRPFFFPFGSYTFDGAGSYARQITKFKIEVKRGVDDGIVTTGLNREDVVPLTFEVDLDATVKYTSRDFYQKVQYGGGSQVPIDLATGTFSAYQSSGSYQMRIVLPFMQYYDAKVNKLDPDGKTVYMDVTAGSLKNATHSIFAVVRTDDQAAYV